MQVVDLLLPNKTTNNCMNYWQSLCQKNDKTIKWGWLILPSLSTCGPYPQQQWTKGPKGILKPIEEYAYTHSPSLRGVGCEEGAAKRAER